MTPSDTRTADQAPRLLRIPEVADYLNCSRQMVYKLIGDGRLASVALGSLTRVSATDLAAYVKSNTTPARRSR
jgi:excisionase family DNA binding protein